MTDHTSRDRIDPRPERAIVFVSCLVDQFRPQVGDAVVEVLDDSGITCEVPAGQTCCGQPAFNSGYRAEAREVASRFLDIFDAAGDAQTPIVSPSGSCTAMVRNFYPILFADDPAELERVERVSNRLWEFSELLTDGLGQGAEVAAETDAKDDKQQTAITYHKCCHALRELGLDEQPQSLIRSLDNIETRELERSEVCCGFGGSFSVKMPDISTAMLDEKLDNVEKTGAETLVAGDTGCIMHMAGGLRRRSSKVQVIHIAELIAASRREAKETATPTEESPAQ